MLNNKEPIVPAVQRRRIEAIVRRVVTRLKAPAGCQCRVSTEIRATNSGDLRVHVWAISPCRIHMASHPLSESVLARKIESEANDQIARLREFVA